MTNYEALKEAIEEMENISKLGGNSYELQLIVYLASIAQSLARLADAIELNGNEQE